jgi:hypothetical protein
MEIEMEVDYFELNKFDMPYRNPFKQKGETQSHFIRRCNRSMAELKRNLRKLFGVGTVYRNPNKKRGDTHLKHARNFPKIINGGH